MITIYSEIIESNNTASKLANGNSRDNKSYIIDNKVYDKFKKLIDTDLTKLNSIQWKKEKDIIK
jgi:hypothetical protein